jgi:hypothetical protein
MRLDVLPAANGEPRTANRERVVPIPPLRVHRASLSSPSLFIGESHLGRLDQSRIKNPKELIARRAKRGARFRFGVRSSEFGILNSVFCLL